MARAKKPDSSYFDRLEDDIKSNQNTLSLVLGALIVIVVGILLFNYFNKQEPQITPESETTQEGDVSPNQLPGKYTVKEGDTLFTIAEKYYNDGYKYEEIAKANDLADVNTVTVGQELTIPKVEGAQAAASPASPSETPTPAPAAAEASPNTQPVSGGTGGADNTIWGAKIEGSSYTVVEGDWLSTIAARAYGDIMAYNKIAQANNIQNPDLIEPGQVLKLPR